MDFIKKNWEKVLLAVVLLGLAVAVAFLPLKIVSERQALEETRNRILNPEIKPLPPVDLTDAETFLNRAQAPFRLDFSTGHRLFNPVLWQKTPDGNGIKVQTGKEIGPDALVILKTTPLYFIVSLDSVVTNETGARYAIGVERQAEDRPVDRRKRQTYVSVGGKSDFFTLKSIKGPPQSPTELIVEIADSGDTVAVSKDKPYKRVDGYLADLRYPPEKRSWLNKRRDDKLTFGGEDYNIVAINETEAVISASSGRKTVASMGVAP